MTMGGGNFFYFLSQYLLVAAMPLYILKELHGNERDAGLAMTYFQLGTVLCRPFAGISVYRMGIARSATRRVPDADAAPI